MEDFREQTSASALQVVIIVNYFLQPTLRLSSTSIISFWWMRSCTLDRLLEYGIILFMKCSPSWRTTFSESLYEVFWMLWTLDGRKIFVVLYWLKERPVKSSLTFDQRDDRWKPHCSMNLYFVLDRSGWC